MANDTWNEEIVDITPTVEGAKAHYKAGKEEWIPTTVGIADYFLNVLPPIYGSNGCFACSEPYTHNRFGEGVYLAFRNVNRHTNTAEAKYCTRKQLRENA